MRGARAIVVGVGLLLAAVQLTAQQARVTLEGRAIVQVRGPEGNAAAAWEYSRTNHSGPWLLIEFAMQAKKRVAVDRNQITLLTPKEEIVRLATQQQFLEDQPVLTKLLQNATVTRRPLSLYFTSPLQPTIQFFSFPGKVVHDDFVTNQDEVAYGDLLFKSPTGRWAAGAYRLNINHPDARVQLPIELD
jgi:hypothetical protein